MNYPETVVRLRATTAADAHGNDVRSWSTATSTTVTGVQVQPVTSGEPEPGRDEVVTDVRLLTAKGVDLDLLHTDRITWGGDTWEVVGDVERHRSPVDGAVHHVEALLRKVAG